MAWSWDEARCTIDTLDDWLSSHVFCSPGCVFLIEQSGSHCDQNIWRRRLRACCSCILRISTLKGRTFSEGGSRISRFGSLGLPCCITARIRERGKALGNGGESKRARDPSHKPHGSLCIIIIYRPIWADFFILFLQPLPNRTFIAV